MMILYEVLIFTTVFSVFICVVTGCEELLDAAIACKPCRRCGCISRERQLAWDDSYESSESEEHEEHLPVEQYSNSTSCDTTSDSL